MAKLSGEVKLHCAVESSNDDATTASASSDIEASKHVVLPGEVRLPCAVKSSNDNDATEASASIDAPEPAGKAVGGSTTTLTDRRPRHCKPTYTPQQASSTLLGRPGQSPPSWLRGTGSLVWAKTAKP